MVTNTGQAYVIFCRQNLRAVKEGRVAIVDGNQMFARPGPRLVDALEFLVGLLHNRPELIPADFPWTWWDTQKAATSAESNSESPSVAINGNACSDTATDSSQVPDGSSSGLACNGAAGNGIALPVDGNSQSSAGTSDASFNPAPAEQPGSVKQNGGGSGGKAGQKAAEQSGSTSQNGGSTGGQQAGQQAAERKWGAAPFLAPEIEEAHAAAIDAGQPTYTDPATGYKVALCCISS